MIKKLLNLIIIFLLFPNILFAKSEFFEQGINLYNKKKFDDAKFKFEQDLVFNPKNELSYLYLSKIFNKQEKKALSKQNSPKNISNLRNKKISEIIEKRG